MKEFFEKNKLKLKIMLVFSIMIFIIVLVFYPLMPSMLNYPAGTYNNDFQWELEKANYTMQFVEIASIVILIYCIIVMKKLSFLNKLDKAKKENDINLLTKIRDKLYKVPDEIYLLQVFIPSICVPILYALSTGFIGITTIKVFIIYASFIIITGTFSSIFVRSEFVKILTSQDLPLEDFEKKTSIMRRMRYQIIPLIIVALMFTSLLGYSLLINDSADTSYHLYKTKLDDAFETQNYAKLSDVTDIISGISLPQKTDKIYIMYPDGSYHDANGSTLEFSAFWVKYTNEFSIPNNSMVYDYYGFDTRGVLKEISINGQKYYVGIQYDLTSYPALIALGISMFCVFILNLVTLHTTARSLADEVQGVSKGMKNIVKKISYDDKLPVTSNDEIGELVVSFNAVQELSKTYINEIQDSQNMLVERERLASLGQMIGGIAHNLKTPIMSISGAAEGLTELVSEYVASIDNPIVTKEDHKAIAKDMLEWITKIKTHTSYMSDIITTVKGQATQLSASSYESFTIYDLSKRVDILMKHELKRANLELHITINCEPTLKLNGDINSLIQVINNLVANSIQAYDGKPGEEILFDINADEKYIYLVVSDHACGIPKDVQEKLFKEMYTSKGKNGTGLGLYMSYSTIKGKFSGEMSFESEVGKGTTFKIVIPYK